MAKFTLTIETNDAAELADITAAIADDMAELEHAENPAPKAEAVVERPTPAKRGRPAKSTAASAAEATDASPAEETPSGLSPLMTASPSEPVVETVVAVNGDKVTAADCKIALNAAMERGIAPADIQAKLIADFGAGSILKIDEARYGELKTFLEGLKK